MCKSVWMCVCVCVKFCSCKVGWFAGACLFCASFLVLACFFAFFFCVFIFGRCVVPFCTFILVAVWCLSVSSFLVAVWCRFCAFGFSVWVKGGKAWES